MATVKKRGHFWALASPYSGVGLEDATKGATGLSDEDFDRASLGKSRAPLARLMILLSTLGAALFYYSTRREVRANEVAVVVTGCSEACRQSIALSLTFQLETQGFRVPVRHGSEARGHPQELRLSLDALRREGETALVEVRLVTQAGTDFEEERLVVAVDGEGEDDAALVRAGLSGVDALFSSAVARLLRSPQVQTLIEHTPRGSATAAAEHATLSRAMRRANRRDDERGRYDQACAEADGEGCITPRCRDAHLVGFDEGGYVLQMEDRAPVFPIEEAHRLRPEPSAEQLVFQGEGAPRAVLSARDLYSYASVDAGRYAYVEASIQGFSLRVVDGDEGTTLVRAARPARLRSPRLRGDFVLFETLPFASGDPVLKAVRVAGGEAFEVAPFGHQGVWVRLREGEGLADYVAVRVAGIRADALRALEAQSASALNAETPGGLTEADEAEAVDDIDELDLDELSRLHLASGLPPRDHIALVKLGAAEPEVRMRFGGRTYPLFFAASDEGALVLVRADAEGCEAARVEQPFESVGPRVGEYADDAITWTRLSVCPEFPVVAGGYLFGTARVPGPGELHPLDAEEPADESSSHDAARMDADGADAGVGEDVGGGVGGDAGADAGDGADVGDGVDAGDGVDPDASSASGEAPGSRPAEPHGVEHPSLDREVVRIDLRDGSFEALTADSFDARFVRAAAGDDGLRVAYERREASPYAGFRRSRVCVVDGADRRPSQPTMPSRVIE
ncbi:MAG: hypothetical protein AAF938_04270 [Myxococcota bacterium]